MVSVIVPNYNHARFLDERLSSILNQSYQDFELIILDDNSSDNSREVIDKYKCSSKVSEVVYYDLNSGSPFEQWHKGIQMSKGDWVWIAESDDVADLQFLEILMEIANSYTSVGLIYSQLRAIDYAGSLIYETSDKDDVFYSGVDFLKNRLVYSTTIFNVSSCIFKKSVYNKIDNSLFRQYRHSGDYMFYIQLAEVCDVYECGKCLCSFRFVENSVSHKLSYRQTIDESINILDYITCRYKIPQYKYVVTYSRYLYKNKFNRWQKINIIISYIKHGYLLFPFVYLLYLVRKSLVFRWLP